MRRLPGKLFDFFYINYRATTGGSISSHISICYDDIMQCEKHWLSAIMDELRSMSVNNVWRFVKCPGSVKPLKAKWVFRVKNDVNGISTQYKARFVAKGFLQKAGQDYEETFAPVAKFVTIRTMLSAGVHLGFSFHHKNVKTAFLYGELKEIIYMAVPD